MVRDDFQVKEVSQPLSKKRKKIDAATTFTVANKQIPTVSEELLKSLGRWYDSSMEETKRGQEIAEFTSEGILAINRCGLQGKFKVWCPQFMPPLAALCLRDLLNNSRSNRG